MAALARRVWRSVLLPTSSSSSEQSSPGVFGQLPVDILYAIFALLPAHDLASASLVCKSWYSVAGREELWKKILIAQSGSRWPFVQFAESWLGGGPPHRSVKVCLPSFRKIYGARKGVPRSVVIDGGSGYCKYGWGNMDKPSGRVPTFLAFGSTETPMYGSLKEFFNVIFERLAAKPNVQPAVISTPICHNDDTEVAALARRNLRQVTYRALFSIGVPAVCAVDQAVLALYAAKQTSGIVVNIGFQFTSVVPILHGKIMRKIGVEVTGQGALHLTSFLCAQMQQSGIAFDNITTVKALKETLCYVAQDYEAELRKNTEACCVLENVGTFKLNHERFRTSEMLFHPRLGGLQAMSLHQVVALCMEHCAQANGDYMNENGWFCTIVLCGGTASLPGLAERLEKELCKILPYHLTQKLAVIPPQQTDSAWFGASLLSNLSRFQEAWCITKKEYKRHGQDILDQEALDD